MINTKYKVAKYIRLSDEDRDKKESESVENQRDIIDNFIEKNIDLEEFDEYVDDGYTGGNFDEGIYDEKETLRRKPQFLKRPETDNEYDRQMFERIQEEICNLQEKINCRDRF